MKKTILLIILSLSLHSFSQNSGINIKNKESKINNYTPIDSISEKDKPIYVTNELILSRYIKEKISKQNKNINEKILALDNDSNIENGSYSFTNNDLKKRLKEIDSLKIEVKNLSKKNDSLMHIYNKDYLQYDRYNFFLGVKNSEAFFDIVYGDTGKRFRLLNNTGFTIGNSTGSLYSELVSGNLGVFRVSFGTMVTSSSKENLNKQREDEAFQRLSTYGGNTVLKFEYPLAYIHSRNNQYNLLSRVVAKGTADFPEFGTTTDSFAGSFSYGLDFYADASLKNNELRFFANLNINSFYGSDTYKNNLGINKNNFSFGQLTLGLVVLENIKLSFIINTFSSESKLRNNKVTIGGQILH